MNYNYNLGTSDWNAVWSAIATYIACIAIFAIIIIALQIIAYWKILQKAGYNGAWSLLVLVPGIGGLASIGILLFLAFSEWPAMRRPPAAAVYVPPPAPYPTSPPPGGPGAPPGYSPPPPPMMQAPTPSPVAAPPAAPVAEPPAPPVAETPAMPTEPPVEPPAPPVEPPAPPAPPAEPSA